MINEVIIDGIKYVAVDAVDEENTVYGFHCADCDIYKTKPPRNMAQVPLCCEEEYRQVNESCSQQECNGIKRIWKKKED